MKAWHFAPVLLLAVAPAVLCPLSAAPISPAAAYGQVGQCMTVEGRAAVMPDPSRLGTDIRLEGDTPARFQAYVANSDALPGLSSLDGQSVDITGVVLMDKGVAEIQLNSPDYIWPVGSEPDRLVACDRD